MKIPAKLQKEIIDGMLVMLMESYEETEVIKTYKGSSIKNFMNIHTDIKGNPIIESQTYTMPEKVTVKVNHGRRMRALIEQAPNEEAMQMALGNYLAKYAKSKEEVVQQIPAHLRKKK